MTDQPHVQVSGSKEGAVEPPKEGTKEKDRVFRRFMSGRHRFEERGAENRCQDQGHQHRQEHGGDDGHGKLAIDDAGGAGEKGHGSEDRREDQPDADQGAGDLLHGLGRGLPGRTAPLRRRV